MRINNNNYAYPVLSEFNQDYIDSVFKVSFMHGKDDVNRVYIDVDITLSNNELEMLIKRDNALLVLHIEGSHTSQRKLIPLKDYFYRFYIDEKIYSGKIELNVLIIANKTIVNYANSKFNPKIFGENYSVRMIEKGMILAATITQSVDISSDKDQLKNISSIIKVGLTKDHEDMMVDYSDDFILVQLPDQELQMYKQLSQTKYADLVLTSVIYPTLIYILENMKEGGLSNYTWYQVISRQVEKLGYSIHDIGEGIQSFELAHRLLGRPLSRALHPNILED